MARNFSNSVRTCLRSKRRAVALSILLGASACGGGGASGPAVAPQPPSGVPSVDLADLGPEDGLIRFSGSDSTGRFGVPVASGFDCDGDGHQDFAMSGMQASPFGRSGAGQVWLVFGDGTIGASVDSATDDANTVVFAGAAPAEATGGEIWMDDVTGDGIGDLIIGRFNYRNPSPDRIGAGALTIVAGGPALRNLAATRIDLAAPPAELTVVTLVGAGELDRLGFWMRTGDLSGDGVADIVVGADQADANGESNTGMAYLIRGGAQLSASATIDLAAIAGSALDGHIATVLPPPGSSDYHFGATVALADLDGNAKADVLIAAALSRVGGLIVANGAPADSAVRNGGNTGGSVFILWDDNVPAANPWPSNLVIDTGNPSGTLSRIDGAEQAGVFTSERFGEDLLGGSDYDGDGAADLYVGDIRGDATSAGIDSGLAHIFFDAAALKGRSFSMRTIPDEIRVTTVLGAAPGTISGDTSIDGDIDGDGNTDLVISSPLDAPDGRVDAGTIHIFWGQPGPWPERIDLAADSRPDPSLFRITDILGARGRVADDDQGDTLMYSAAVGDLNADGRSDLVVNEMRGNGVAADALDVGNLLVIDGRSVPR